MTTGEKLFSTTCFIVTIAIWALLAVLIRGDEPRVSMRLHHTPSGDSIECHVPIDSQNRWLDIIIEDVTGSGHDLTEQRISSYVMEIPQPLQCPYTQGGDTGPDSVPGYVRVACELSWMNLLTGHMQTDVVKTNLVCQP